MPEIRIIALIAGLLPVIAVYMAYYLASSAGHVPACIPNLEGCTSISSAGRASPESLFFRATMIPSAMFMMLFWVLIRQWLIKIEGGKNRQQIIIQSLGIIAAVFLIIYTVALGFIGEIYSLQRRTGVSLFFSCQLLAQLITTDRIWRLAKAGRLQLPGVVHMGLLILCVLLMLLGLLSIPLSVIYPDNSIIDNILEWNFAVIMYVYYIMIYFAWRATDFRVEFHTR